MNEKKMIAIDDTRFIFETNFAGDKSKDRWGDDRRKANIIIPDPRQAQEMIDAGFKVRQTKPREDDDPDEFIPTYFVQALLKYSDRYGHPLKYPPKVYLVNMDGEPVPLSEESVSCLDRISVANVNVILNSWQTEDGSYSLYIRTMYVEQDFDDDPYAARYAKRRNND